MTTPDITIRRVDADDDRRALDRLAALDSARPLLGDALLATVDGVAVAAVGVADGRVVADPFVPTAPAVELLRIRAAHLRDPGAARVLPRLRVGTVARRRAL